MSEKHRNIREENEKDEILKEIKSCKSESKQDDTVSDEEITVVCSEDEYCNETAKERKRADETFDRLVRLQAEFDNYRKRTTETNKTVRDDGRRDVIEKLLPVLDATEQAMLVIKDESVLKGLSLIMVQLSDALTAFGVKKIEALGQNLDINIHDVVGMRQDEKNSGKVIEVFRSGYIINGRVLRPAAVIVGE